MIVLYLSSGEIVASFPEVYDLPSFITVEREGEMAKRLLISPEDAVEFEDPRNPKDIHQYKVVNGTTLVKK